MSAADSSEVVGLHGVTPENIEKGASPSGTENRDLLTTTPGFLEENTTLSTTYPAHAIVVEEPDCVNVAVNLQISLVPELAYAPEFVDKVLPQDDRLQSVQLLTRAAKMDRVLGRPKEFDQPARAKFCVLLKLGYNRSLAAAQLGLHRSTISKTMERDPIFKREVLRAEELYDSLPLLTIMEAAQTDWRAAVWLKEHHDPHASMRRRRKRQTVRENLRLNDELDDIRDVAQEKSTKRQQAKEKRAQAKAAEDKAQEERRWKELDKLYLQQDKERVAKVRELKAQRELVSKQQNPQSKAAAKQRLAVLKQEFEDLKEQQRQASEKLKNS